MKSNKISIYALLLAGIGLWSCNNDDMEQAAGTLSGGSGEMVDMTFSATMGTSLSKSTVSATTGETQFSSEDHIKVFADGTAAEFACAGVSDDGKEAQFAGTIKKTNSYYALLPYQEKATASGNTLTVTIPAEQTSKYEELMVGYTANDAQAFQFKHVGAMIRFNTQKKFSSIEIEDTKGTKIAGDVSVKIGTDGTITEVSGGTSTTVSVTRDIEKAEYVLITIKPGTYEANELRIHFKDKSKGYSFTHIIDKQVTFNSGVIYSYGNVGKWLITCYDNDNPSKVLFKLYAADYDQATGGISGKAVLPQLTADNGYVFGYDTKANSTRLRYTTNINNVTSDITLYTVKVKGISVKVYNNGADKEPVEILACPGSEVTLPEIIMQPKEGHSCGYSRTPNGEPTLMPGSTIDVEESPISIYAVEIESFTANIYTDATSQKPAKTFSGIGGFTFTLPSLPAKSGYFAGYNTTANSDEIKYYQGQSILYDTYIFDQTTNFYPVYRELVDITKTNTVSLAGVTVGTSDLNSTEILGTLTKVEKGTCSVFKFTNHCNPSGLSSDNVTIQLKGKNDISTSSSKKISVNQKQYGEAEFYLGSGDFMSNINNTEVTVKVYNKGGVADVEVTWTGSNDRQSNTAKFNNISTWDELYVTFGVKNSYIELK